MFFDLRRLGYCVRIQRPRASDAGVLLLALVSYLHAPPVRWFESNRVKPAPVLESSQAAFCFCRESFSRIESTQTAPRTTLDSNRVKLNPT